MKANSNIYPYPQRQVNKFRALKKKRIRKKARDIITGRYTESSGRANVLSILGLVVIFLILFYLGPHSYTK